MKETVYRLRITPNSGKAIFADTSKENYEALLAQAKAEGTFKVYVVRATPKDKPRYTQMEKVQKALHPNWPFLTKIKEDKAWRVIYKSFTKDKSMASDFIYRTVTNAQFEEIYGFEPGSRDYSLLVI